MFPKENFTVGLSMDPQGWEILSLSKTQTAHLPIGPKGLVTGAAIRRCGNALIRQGRPVP
jgi:hypothetical protein